MSCSESVMAPRAEALTHPAVPLARPDAGRVTSWRLLGGLLALLAVGGCGKSDEEKARDMVDSTLAGISKGLEHRVYVNRKDSMSLSPNLKRDFVPFSFAYPSTWEVLEGGEKPTRVNFIKVERKAAQSVTGESFAVGTLVSPPSADAEAYKKEQLALLEPQFSQGFPAFKKVGDETTTVGGKPAWGFRFSSHLTAEETGDLEGDMWGLVLAVPNVIENRGVVLIMLGTSMSGALTSAADVGVRGELPMLLSSFRFGE